MTINLIIVILAIFGAAQVCHCQPVLFGVARQNTPVLNSADFAGVFGGKDGRVLKSDRCGQVRELEFIALPGTVFKVLKEQKRGPSAICRVETDEYHAPPGVRLYVDCSTLMLGGDAPTPRARTLPARERVVKNLKDSLGSSYVWGGNLQSGIPELAKWFPGTIGQADAARFTLAGLDCSGLLYQATGGWTPRNTSQLVTYGKPVPVGGRQVSQILPLLEPLDLIVWNGHVVIVLDRENAIESRLECGKPGHGGVVVTPLDQRLREIMRSRRPADIWPAGSRSKEMFVVRRWYGL
ncbi:MAG: peptidoglycan endopeptidase [Geobacteraceae bacterium]|nr:peptidoglycan endopeptidase [Geobacteraceae bacterium]